MTVALTLLKLLGWPLKALWIVVSGWWHWASEDLRHVAISILAVALLWNGMGWRTAAHQRDAEAAAAASWKAKAGEWQAAHGRLVKNIAAKRAAAEAADRANAARVDKEFEAIRQRTADDYEDRLDDTRAALERVRGQLAQIAAGDPGERGAAAVPAPLTARCRALGAADCDALLAALPDQLAAAEDNTAKLIALQAYVRSMLAIDYLGDDTIAPKPDGEPGEAQP